MGMKKRDTKLIEFFQTRGGQNFFSNTLPRLVKAIEALATKLEGQKTRDLAQRVETLELLHQMPSGLVSCKDGYSIKIGKKAPEGYKLSFPSSRDLLLERYLVTNDVITYEEVPPKILAELLVNHGGVATSAQLVQ